MQNRIAPYKIICLLALYFAAIVGLIDTLNAVALYIIIPIAFAICFLYNNTIRTNKYIRIILILYIWLCITYFAAVYTEPAIRELRQILGAFIFCYIIATLASEERFIPWLYVTFLLLYIAAFYYAATNITNISIQTDRLNDQKLNANTLAYYTFYITFILFMFGELVKNKKSSLPHILFCCTIILSFFVALLTGSRQVLIIQIPLISILLFIRYIKFNLKSIAIGFFIIVCSCILYVQFGSTIYNNSVLKQRSEISLKEDSRPMLIKQAIQVGCEHPITGVGPGNFRLYSSSNHFSHCTYTELFANAGVIGFLLYTYMLLYFIAKQRQRYKRTKDKMFKIFSVFGLFFIADNFFYVFYNEMWLLSFFVLVATHSEVYYKRQYQFCRL